MAKKSVINTNRLDLSFDIYWYKKHHAVSLLILLVNSPFISQINLMFYKQSRKLSLLFEGKKGQQFIYLFMW